VINSRKREHLKERLSTHAMCHVTIQDPAMAGPHMHPFLVSSPVPTAVPPCASWKSQTAEASATLGNLRNKGVGAKVFLCSAVILLHKLWLWCGGEEVLSEVLGFPPQRGFTHREVLFELSLCGLPCHRSWLCCGGQGVEGNFSPLRCASCAGPGPSPGTSGESVLDSVQCHT